MAFTKIVGAGIHTLSNVHTHNINSSGIITATQFVGLYSGTDGDFSGNVTIDGNLTVNGTTTTLDTNLTEVDKLEVAANNSTVGAAITQSGTGDILNLYDGSSEVFSVADGGAVTATGNINVNSGAAGAVTIAANGDIRFANSGSWSGEVAGKIQYFSNRLYFQGGSNGHQLRDPSGGTTFEIGTTGICAGVNLTLGQDVTFSGIATASSTLFAKNFSTSGIGTFADIHVKSNADDTRITSIAPGALILSRTTPVIYLKNNLSDTFDASIELQSNEIRFRGGGNNATGIRMETTSSGVSFPQNIDVDGHTELDNTNIVGVATVNGNFNVVNGNILQTKTGANVNLTVSRNESVGTTDQPLGVIDFASNTAHTVQARLMAKSLGTSNVGGDLIIETREDGGTLDERVRFTGDGKVGVGTASPNSIIQATGSTSNTGYYFKNTHTTSGFGMRIEGGGTTADRYSLAVFNAAGEEAFRVNANKKVGIGSAIPTAKLDIADAAQTNLLTLKRTSGNSGIFSVQLGGSDPGVLLTTSGISDDFVFRPGGNDRLRITSSGNLTVTGSTANLFTSNSYMTILVDAKSFITTRSKYKIITYS